MNKFAFCFILCLFISAFFLFGCEAKKSTQQQVVIYTSLDKVFSQPILEAFEKQTGIKVLAVYDSEATKTTGLIWSASSSRVYE